ncbi:MAG: ASKHA domain-containing protein [Dehalococcoidales bacterium]|nr:ASKHA domain-containing protein [Dehalococcoidales bacterium]
MVKHLVIFQPSGKRGKIEEGKTLLQAAQELGVDIESVCGGKLICGKCVVEVDDDNAALSPITGEERDVLAKRGLGAKYRLACRAVIEGSVTVFVPEASRRMKQTIRKSIRRKAVPVKPAIRKYYVEMSPPKLDDLTGDAERLLVELKKSFGLEGLTFDYLALTGLADVLRHADWKATVSVWMDKEIIRVEPGYVEHSYGIAVDIGTTSVGGYLCDLTTGDVLASDAIMNPQVSYGEDVMSRITYAKLNSDGLVTLHRVIVEGINQLTAIITRQAGISGEDILEMAVVGNTAMHHLFLGLDPEYLGRSPYVPVVSRSFDVKARELRIALHKSANVHILPNEAGFVGADAVGVLIAEEPHKQDKMVLVIDIGTNGELLLGNREKLVSASCAMGPALEGATIRFGMRAAAGAVEHVTIDEKTLDVGYKLIGNDDWGASGKFKAQGLCGSGIIDAVAEMFKTGIIGRKGHFNLDLESPRLVPGNNPGFVIVRAEESASGEDITVCQSDVRSVQLAKAAMYAGCKLLMRRLGVSTVDRVMLSGAFGSYISKTHAMVLGLFPDCDLAHVFSVGNSAGEGARMVLVNTDKRQEAEDMARKVEYIELAAEAGFQREFVNALNFPHFRDGFPHLKSILGEKALP